MEPALKSAAGYRTPQTTVLEPEFFNSSFGEETTTKAEKQDQYPFGKVKTVPAKPSPVTQSVTVIKPDYVLCSTGFS